MANLITQIMEIIDSMVKVIEVMALTITEIIMQIITQITTEIITELITEIH